MVNLNNERYIRENNKRSYCKEKLIYTIILKDNRLSPANEISDAQLEMPTLF